MKPMKLKVIGNPVEAAKVLNSPVAHGDVLEYAPGSAIQESVEAHRDLFVIMEPKDFRPGSNKMLVKTARLKAK